MAKHIKSSTLSIAKMQSPGGWIEPGQIPKFDEYTVVLRGLLKVDTKNESFEVRKGEAIIISSGEWVRYSSPGNVQGLMAVSPRMVKWRYIWRKQLKKRG
jgi:mannose-6-phosphate isomerase-like protein (cupin superfamily)